jgi:hypothetical protein
MCANDQAEVVADFAQKFAVRAELQKLCRGGGVGRTGGVAAVQHEDMALRVHRDPADFAEIHVIGKLQRIGHGFEINHWRGLLLRKCRSTQHQK